MELWIYDKDGGETALGGILSWEFCHGFGQPCDSFELKFLWKKEMAKTLESACGIRAMHEGRVVFKGRIDEYCLKADARGGLGQLSGRGMQALLLDNEAESADYYNADLTYILSRHVQPFGIGEIDTSGAEGSTPVFTVESGESHWGVLEEFARFCCGVKPRFSPEGALIMNGEAVGKSMVIDSTTPFTDMEYRQDRYGVISSVKIKKYSSGVVLTMDNAQFKAIGGSCGRIINVPKKTGYDSMRYTAKYRMDRSLEDFRKMFVTLPWAFAAFPGDKIEVKDSPMGTDGAFLVVGSRCRCDGAGVYTRLEMRRI